MAGSQDAAKDIDPVRVAAILDNLRRQGHFLLTATPQGVVIHYSVPAMERAMRDYCVSHKASPEEFFRAAEETAQKLGLIAQRRVEAYGRFTSASLSPLEQELVNAFDLSDVEVKYRLQNEANLPVYCGATVLLERRKHEDNTESVTALLALSYGQDLRTGHQTLSLPLTRSDIRHLMARLKEAETMLSNAGAELGEAQRNEGAD